MCANKGQERKLCEKLGLEEPQTVKPQVTTLSWHSTSGCKCPAISTIDNCRRRLQGGRVAVMETDQTRVSRTLPCRCEHRLDPCAFNVILAAGRLTESRSYLCESVMIARL